MAFTGFGGSWSNGVHTGGDDGGSIGGGSGGTTSAGYDGNGNIIGTRAPIASEVASQFNSYHGAQISSGQVSNIRSDGNGGYVAHITDGVVGTVSMNGGNPSVRDVGGFNAVPVHGASDGNHSATTGTHTTTTTSASQAADIAAQVRAGKMPPGYKIQNGQVGYTTPHIIHVPIGHGEIKDEAHGTDFHGSPYLTNLYNEGIRERQQYHDAVSFVSGVYQKITSEFGSLAAQQAHDLISQAKGRKIQSVDQAVAAFEKFGANIDKKYNAADREAIAKALSSVNKAQIAANLIKISRGLNIVGYGINAWDVFAVNLPAAIRTKDWRTFFVKAEAIVAGWDAVALAGLALAVIDAPLAPATIIGYALFMAAISAFVDDALIKEVNKLIGL